MKRWLKSILVLVCVMALCGALTACGSEEKKPDPNALELTQEEQQEWFDQSEQFIYSMDEAAKVYQQTNPDFQINVIENSWDDIQTKLATAAASVGVKRPE